MQANSSIDWISIVLCTISYTLLIVVSLSLERNWKE